MSLVDEAPEIEDAAPRLGRVADRLCRLVASAGDESRGEVPRCIETLSRFVGAFGRVL